ncbi:MAG: arginine--tRNA ligase [Candidatus Eisenbacteria bacterium]|nr:arginine--tRNA ligase [Candidatus Eisenbacteria bacterium]
MLGIREARARLLTACLELAPRPEGVTEVPTDGIAITRPPKPEMGDWAVPAFPLAKAWRRNPAEVAKQWAESMRADLARPDGVLGALCAGVRDAQAAGPYVNLTIDPATTAGSVLGQVTRRGDRFGWATVPTGETVMVEYSGPNTNKPLHLGHLRNNVLGMSLSNLLEAAGHRVIRVNLVNDRGIHICKSMLAYQRWGEGTTPASSGEKGDHFVGRMYVLFDQKLKEEMAAFAAARDVDPSTWSRAALKELTDKDELKRREAAAEAFEREFLAASPLMAEARALLRLWEADDPETRALWSTMNGWVYEGFRATYARLGCRFDKWYYESEVWQLGKSEVERGLETGAFYRNPDGSVWARLESLGMQDRCVLRADGTTVYLTQDIGVAMQKFRDYGMDRSIYVVGSEQDAHFKNLFGVLKLLGHTFADRCHHASYGLITLPAGMGKLKSREGTKVDSDDLLELIKGDARQKIEEGGYCEDPAAIDGIAEMIGQGALKLFLLQVSAEKSIQWNPLETIAFNGDTGPAVQYSHARICGILRKGLAAGLITEDDLERSATRGFGPFLKSERVDPGLLVEPLERDLLRALADTEDVVQTAAERYSPAPLAAHLLELTKAFARMYHEHEVLRAASPELARARLQLSLAVAQALRNGLALLTIEAPDRM